MSIHILQQIISLRVSLFFRVAREVVSKVLSIWPVKFSDTPLALQVPVFPPPATDLGCTLHPGNERVLAVHWPEHAEPHSALVRGLMLSSDLAEA